MADARDSHSFPSSFFFFHALTTQEHENDECDVAGASRLHPRLRTPHTIATFWTFFRRFLDNADKATT
jgi:hypothetical protein